MSTELVLITLLKLFHIPFCLEVQHFSSILRRLLQHNCVEIDKEFYLIGKIGVNDKEAKVKDKSNEVLEQTEKELINFVTA